MYCATVEPREMRRASSNEKTPTERQSWWKWRNVWIKQKQLICLSRSGISKHLAANFVLKLMLTCNYINLVAPTKILKRLDIYKRNYARREPVPSQQWHCQNWSNLIVDRDDSHVRGAINPKVQTSLQRLPKKICGHHQKYPILVYHIRKENARLIKFKMGGECQRVQ